MKILWSNGYQSGDYPTESAVQVLSTPSTCQRCLYLQRDGAREKTVATLDCSDGEYTPIQLCHECLVDLANELL